MLNFNYRLAKIRTYIFPDPSSLTPWLPTPLRIPAPGCPVAPSLTPQSVPQCPHQLLLWGMPLSQPWVILHAHAQMLSWLPVVYPPGEGMKCLNKGWQGSSKSHVAVGPRWGQGDLSRSLCLVRRKSLPLPVHGDCLIVAKRIKFKALSLSPVFLSCLIRFLINLPAVSHTESPRASPSRDPSAVCARPALGSLGPVITANSTQKGFVKTSFKICKP